MVLNNKRFANFVKIMVNCPHYPCMGALCLVDIEKFSMQLGSSMKGNRGIARTLVLAIRWGATARSIPHIDTKPYMKTNTLAKPKRVTTIVTRNKPSYPRGFIQQPTMLVDAVANFLDTWKWDYFGTFTTEYELSIKSTRRLMDVYTAQLNLFNLKRGLIDEPTLVSWFAEVNPNRGGHHIHALIKSSIGVQDQFQVWQRVSGSQWPKGPSNRVKIESYMRTLGANYYVSKYITKSHCDWDINSYNAFYFAGYDLEGNPKHEPRADCKRIIYNNDVDYLDPNQLKLL